MVSLLLAQQQRGHGVIAPVGKEWTHQQIVDIIGSPIENVDANWPLLQKYMALYGHTHRLEKVGACATVGVETSSFAPINEFGSDAYFHYMYDITSPDANRRLVAAQLGNDVPGDGIKYHGRGKLQLTGKGNYTRYGERIGVNLRDNPELALDPDVSSHVFVLYFNDRDLWSQCLAQNWLSVRRGVNGGTTGIRDFMKYVMYFTYINVIEDWRVTVLSDGASHWGDPYTWDGELPGGFDCSGFVHYEYGLTGRQITSYTDTAFAEVFPASPGSEVPGDPVFYEYVDPSQPGVIYPHMGLWLDQSRTLDSRGGVGVGIHPHVNGSTIHVRKHPQA